MKNLSDFKKVLQSCMVHKIGIRSKVINRNGETVKENPFAPVGHIQSNSFALLRDGKLSWAEYGKSKDWTFEGGTAKKIFMDGGHIVFELQTPEFFGL